jgi:hypothetical protein
MLAVYHRELQHLTLDDPLGWTPPQRSIAMTTLPMAAWLRRRRRTLDHRDALAEAHRECVKLVWATLSSQAS